MFELVLRIGLATALLLVSGATGKPPFDIAWREAAFFAAYSFLVYALEKRGARNAGVAGLVAAADSAAVVLCLSASGLLEQLGFLALVPPAFAALRFGSDAVSMAPISAAWILIGSNLFGNPGWTPLALAQAAGVLAVGLLGARRERVVKVTEYVEVSHEGVESEPVPNEFFELREKFRVLRNHASDLERRSRRDRLTVQLTETNEEGLEGPVALAKRLREVLKVEGLTLYAYSQSLDRLIVQAIAGEVPNTVSDTAVDLPEFMSEWQLRERLNATLHALKTPDQASQSSTVVLKERGRIVGMVAMFDGIPSRLEEACDLLKEASEIVARLLKLMNTRQEETRRLRQSELLYTVAATCQGADSPSTLAQRVVRELWETLRLDHLSVQFLDGGDLAVAAHQGARSQLLEVLTFPSGPGLEGWIAAGGPEVVLPDARDDERVPKQESLKRRIGSFVAVPLSFNESVYGVLCAFTHRVLGVEADTLETIRLVAAEMSQALGRIENGHRDASGLASPLEFQELVRANGTGHMVYLEVPRREELVESYGRVAVDFAARRLAARLRTKLPVDSLMCRRAEGDFMVYLRSNDGDFARSWANDAVATAAMTSLTTPDGQTRLPFALRAKVALIAQQSHQISKEATA
ncbi:MAG: GAF domain-containing protein [Armatimonadetes bacterium]|nr:GAF domain-containing protein [Armatimonadota bacterium]